MSYINLRTSQAAKANLVIQKSYFSILPIHFQTQTPSNYLLNSLLLLKIIFQYFFIQFYFFSGC